MTSVNNPMFSIINNQYPSPTSTYGQQSAKNTVPYGDRFSTTYERTHTGDIVQSEIEKTNDKVNWITKVNGGRSNRPHPAENFLRWKYPRKVAKDDGELECIKNQRNDKDLVYSVYQYDYKPFDLKTMSFSEFQNMPTTIEDKIPEAKVKPHKTDGILPDATLKLYRTNHLPTSYEDYYNNQSSDLVEMQAHNVEDGLRRAYRGKRFDPGTTESTHFNEKKPAGQKIQDHVKHELDYSKNSEWPSLRTLKLWPTKQALNMALDSAPPGEKESVNRICTMVDANAG